MFELCLDFFLFLFEALNLILFNSIYLTTLLFYSFKLKAFADKNSIWLATATPEKVNSDICENFRL